MTAKIDLNFRPKSYFGPQKLEQHLIAKVKGAVVKEKLQKLVDEGNEADIVGLLGSEEMSNENIGSLGGLHPMFAVFGRTAGRSTMRRCKVSVRSSPVWLSSPASCLKLPMIMDAPAKEAHTFHCNISLEIKHFSQQKSSMGMRSDKTSEQTVDFFFVFRLPLLTCDGVIVFVRAIVLA